MKNFKGIVVVTQMCDTDQLTDPDDRAESPAGRYLGYQVEALNEVEANDKILDRFHLDVAIGCLDDFEIIVELQEASS